jgi:hypothetical protein
MILDIIPNCYVQEWVELEDFPTVVAFGEDVTYLTDGMDQLYPDEYGNLWSPYCGEAQITVTDTNGSVFVNEENDVTISAMEKGEFYVVISQSNDGSTEQTTEF